MPGTAPTVDTAISDQVTSEDAAWNFTVPAGSFSDVDGDTLTYAATLANGDPLPGWLSFDDATRTFSGTPPANFNGAVDLTVTASDGTLSASDTFSLAIDPVNDRPVLTDAAPVITTITEDATTNTGRTVLSMLGGHATDVDGDALGVAVTGQSSGNGTWQFSLDNGATWSAFGDVSSDDALLLRTTDRVRFLPNGQNGTAAEFTFVAWDRSAGVAGSTLAITDGADSPFSAVTDSATITVTSRNDAPVLTPINPVFALISDSGIVTQKTVAALIGASISDVDTGAATAGIAVTGLQGNGTWEYSHDHGATWTSFGSASDASARLLLATDLVRFTPSSITGGPASLSYVGWDRTSGVAEGVADVSIRGGTTAFSLSHDVASTSGNDLLVGGEGNDTLIGLSGDDTLIGSDGSDSLDGGSGADYLEGDRGDDILLGGLGGDTVYGQDGNDSLDGGSGNDILTGGDGSDAFIGGAGDDTLDSENGDGAADVIYAGDGNDLIFIGYHDGGSSSQFGGAGNDTIESFKSDLSLSGMQDVELLHIANFSADLVLSDINVAAGATLTILIDGSSGGGIHGGSTIDGSAETDGNLVVEITGTPGGDFNLLCDRVIGGGGADTISTGAGDDTIAGGSGDDVIFAGTGFDTVIFSGNQADYTVTLDNIHGWTNVTDNVGTDGTDTLVSVNQLQFADQTVTVVIPGILLIGTDTADTLTGGEGTDSLSGAGGDDTLIGSDGSDTLDGGLGNDSVEGGAGNDSVFGGGGSDFIETSDGNDTVDAGSGNDLIVGGNGAGDDRYTGGSGFDTLRYTSAVTGITVDLVATTATGNEIGSDRLFGIEGIIGGQAGDLISGNGQANRIDGYTGTDTLVGRGGDDIYGVDRIADLVVEVAGEGSDTVITSVTGIVLAANVENLVLAGVVAKGTGNAAANQLTGNAAANALFGGDGHDMLTGDLGNDTLDGGIGNDSLDGGAGTDALKGGLGDDRYIVDVAGDVVTEVLNAGIDTVATALASYTLGANVENLVGIGSVAATLKGNGLTNSITGTNFNDSLDGGAAADTMIGGLGDDSYTVDTAGDVVTEAGNAGTDTVRTSLATFKLGLNVENLVKLGSTASVLSGNSLANEITGNAGNDSLDGGRGDDTLKGGSGDDTYTVNSVGDVVIEAGNGGTDTLRTTLASYTLGINVENLFALKTAAFIGIGNGLANTITGNIGNDSLDGGAGKDTMIGGLGNDTYTVDNTGDVITEALNAGTDTVRTGFSSFTLGANLENLIALGATAFTGVGNGLANALTGGIGNDSLDGGLGIDTMIGGLGNDTYTVDRQADVVTEAAGGGTDTVQTTLANYTLGAEVEKLVALGAGAFNGTGNGLGNTITGNIGNDRIAGLDGNDTMTGGLGDDVFVFNTALSVTNRDTIIDFNPGHDTIKLENTGAELFNALPAGSLDPSAFKLIGPGGTAVDADDRILYKQTTGQLFYDADGSGAGTAILFAVLANTPLIDQTDFLVS